MGKLFKFLIKLILFLLLFIIIIVGILLWILHDSGKTEFVPSAEPLTVENILGDGIDESISRIAKIDNDARLTSDDNYIGFSLTTDDMNNALVGIIREKFNSEYFKEGDSKGIVSESGATLESVLFEEYEGKFAAKAVVTAFGFYRSSITLAGEPKIEGKVLKIEFEDAKLGNKLNISRKFVLGVFNKFNMKFDENGMFDANTLTLSFDISDLLEQYTSSTRFTDFFAGCTYSMDYVKATESSLGRIVLKVDTRNVFTPVDELPKASTSYSLPPIDPLVLTAVVSEADFNYMLKDQLGSAEFIDPIILGDKTFSFELSDLYYDLGSDKIVALMSINELNTSIIANVNLDTVLDDSNNVTELVLKVSTISLGNTTVEADNFFKEIKVPASVLTGGQDMVVVKGFTINKEAKTCEISYALAI